MYTCPMHPKENKKMNEIRKCHTGDIQMASKESDTEEEHHQHSNFFKSVL